MDRFLVPDTSPLIALERLGLLHKFLDCATTSGWKIVITHQVYNEIKTPLELRMVVEEKVHNEEIVLEDSGNMAQSILLYPSLGPGETSVILLNRDERYAQARTLFIIDDKLARRIAKDNGCNVIGTIGIIKALKRKSYLSEQDLILLKNHLASIIYCSPDLINKLDA